MIKLKHLMGIILGLTVITGAYAGDADTTLSLLAVKNVLKKAEYYHKFDPDEVVQNIKEKNGTITPRELMAMCLYQDGYAEKNSLNRDKSECVTFLKDVIIEHNKLVKNPNKLAKSSQYTCLSNAKHIDVGLMFYNPLSKYINMLDQHNAAVDKINEALARGDTDIKDICKKLYDPVKLKEKLLELDKSTLALFDDVVTDFDIKPGSMSEEHMVRMSRDWIMQRMPEIEDYVGQLKCSYMFEGSWVHHVNCDATDVYRFKKHFRFYERSW